MRIALLLAGTLALAGCGAPSRLDGNWVGDVTPRTPGPACLKTRGAAQLRGDQVTFSPNEGTWILTGTVTPDGNLSAERIQLGANKQPFETRLEGHVTPTALTGTYTTPRCTADVVLSRK